MKAIFPPQEIGGLTGTDPRKTRWPIRWRATLADGHPSRIPSGSICSRAKSAPSRATAWSQAPTARSSPAFPCSIRRASSPSARSSKRKSPRAAPWHEGRRGLPRDARRPRRRRRAAGRVLGAEGGELGPRSGSCLCRIRSRKGMRSARWGVFVSRRASRGRASRGQSPARNARGRASRGQTPVRDAWSGGSSIPRRESEARSNLDKPGLERGACAPRRPTPLDLSPCSFYIFLAISMIYFCS